MPDLPDIIEIGYSWKRLLVLLAAAVILTAGCAAMAFHLFPDMRVDAFYTAVGYFGVLFFGFGILKMGWLLLTARGPVLFIDRNGIRDLRVSPNVIPWDAVEQIETGEVKKQAFVTLRVTPALEKQLVASGGKKLMAVANHALGVDGIVLNPSGLQVDAETLFEVCNAYRAANKQMGPDRSGPTTNSV
jgi:hypothetical protein